MSQPRFWVLEGFGIECEKETRRFLTSLYGEECLQSVFLPKLLTGAVSPDFKSGDWIFFPGGFSFSDHFGSGTLLSFELKRSGILAKWLEAGLNFFGVCNGFQILSSLGLFGEGTQLLHNQVNGKSAGFINRWVNLSYEVGDSKMSLQFPVRHGEGRLFIAGPEALRRAGVQAFLRYTDADFDNGSWQKTAGLIARQGRSWIVGMMPHPEIVLRENHGPYHFAGEAMPQHRSAEFKKIGDGKKFFQQLLLDLKEQSK